MKKANSPQFKHMTVPPDYSLAHNLGRSQESASQLNESSQLNDRFLFVYVNLRITSHY